MLPGLRLRQARERLGYTYRDVERISYELASRRSRPEFILHISRLADIENHSVVPGLHKLYALAVVYHLDPLDIFRWYGVPLEDCFADGTSFPPMRTHLAAPPVSLKVPVRFDPAFDPKRTEFLSRMVERWGRLDGALANGSRSHSYGYVGLNDRRMSPLIRPGSLVLVDTSVRIIQDSDWSTEYDRPMYFVDVRDGYRCGWFHCEEAQLVMQPHPLSRCVPESWRWPEDAEVVGRIIGVVTRLDEPWNSQQSAESREVRGDSSKKAP